MAIPVYRVRHPELGLPIKFPDELHSTLFVKCKDWDEAIWGMLSERPAFIYAIQPRGGTPFYIGSTVRTIQHRLGQHLLAISIGRHTNKGFCQQVASIGASNIEVVLLEETTEAYRFTRERSWIETKRDAGLVLVNKSMPSRSAVFTRREGFKSISQAKLFQLFYKTFELIANPAAISNMWQQKLVNYISSLIPLMFGGLARYYIALLGELEFICLGEFRRTHLMSKV